MDPVGFYLHTFEALRKRKRWTTNTVVLRFAALSMASLELADPYGELEAAASELRSRANWFGPLKSEIRYAVAAVILRRGLAVGPVHAQVKRTREAFRKRHGRSHARVREIFASLILVLHQEGGRVPAGTIDRMDRIFRAWKKDHRWLTGADDLPAAAIHAVRDEPVTSIAVRVEEAYRGLHRAGFKKGNPLQLVSHLMAADPRGVHEATGRFERIARDLKRRGEHVRTSRYDEMALLALTPQVPSAIAADVIRIRDRLREARPRPSKEIAFSLAAGLALQEALGEGGEPVGDVAMLQSIQGILEAQQAAMAACVGASAAGAG
jgi:hypothetical protein